jgi:hypothetical protein
MTLHVFRINIKYIGLEEMANLGREMGKDP